MIELIVCLAILGYSAYQDIRTSKVDSRLILIATAVGLIYQLFNLSHIGGFGNYLLRLASVVIIFLFYEGFIGGGDAKILMLLSIWAGIRKTYFTLGFALFLLIIVECFRDGTRMKNILKQDWYAVIGRNRSIFHLDPEYATRVVFVPYLLAGYIISVLVCGIG